MMKERVVVPINAKIQTRRRTVYGLPLDIFERRSVKYSIIK